MLSECVKLPSLKYRDTEVPGLTQIFNVESREVTHGKDATQTQVVAALDIGTTKVACAIGRFDRTAPNGGRLNIIGVGTAPNSGMRHGVVVNIDATSEAIKKAKDEAELMAGQTIHEVWLSTGGQHIQSFASSGMVAIRNKEVQQDDIDRVIEAARRSRFRKIGKCCTCCLRIFVSMDKSEFLIRLGCPA